MRLKGRKVLIYYITMCLLVVNISIPSIKVSSIENPNLLEDGGFESDLKYWNNWCTNDNFKVLIDTLNCYEGKKSLKLCNESSTNVRGAVFQSCDVSGYLGKAIKITQAIRSENFSGTCSIRFKFFSDKGIQIGEDKYKSIYMKKNMDWKNKSYTLDIPDDINIKSMKVEYIYDGIGDICIDNAKIQCIEIEKTSNIAENSSFEEDLNDWNFSKSYGDLNVGIDDTIKKEGCNSLKISNNDTKVARGILSQNIPIEEGLRGSTIKISQWFKTKDLSGTAINLRIRYLDSSGDNAEEICDADYFLLGTNSNGDWKSNKFDVYIPQNAKAIGLDYIYDSCKGSIWIDSVSVEKESREYSNNIIKNGSFESSINPLPGGWQEWYADKDLNYSYDFSEKYDGDCSLKMSSLSDKKSARLTQVIPYSNDLRDKTIKLTQMLKSDENNSVKISINYVDENWNPVNSEYKKSYEILSNNKWNQYILKTVVPDNDKIKNIKIDYRIDNIKGDVWIDDIKLNPYIAANYLSVNPSIFKLKSGQTIKPQIDFLPDNSSYQSVTIKSEDENIARVENNNITGVSKGITKITIEQSYDGLKTRIPVLVDQDNKIDIDEVNNLNLTQGKSIDGKVKINGDYSNLNYSIFSQPEKGYVKLNDSGIFTYYSDSCYVGNDNFSILVKDSNGNEAIAQYNVQVDKDLTKRFVDDFIVTTSENNMVEGSINKYVVNGTTFDITKLPGHGKFEVNSLGEYRYTPDKEYYGYDDVSIKIKKKNNEENVVKVAIFVAPGIDEIKEKINNVHPRSITSSAEINNVRKLINTDKTAKNWFNKLQKEVDQILDKPVVDYNVYDGLRLNTDSEGYIEKLSFMYQITGENKYAERAWKEIENVCNYKDWNSEGQFLDTAVLSSAVAVGYDLIYDYLSDNQRKIVEKAIEDKALRIADDLYKNNANFTLETHNWNIVCNSAMLISSLVIGNKHDNDLELRTIQNSLRSVQYFLNSYYKDGSSYEGPTYWILSTNHLIKAVSCLQNSLNMGDIFDEKINYKELSEYPLHIGGSTASFNYSDAGDGFIPSYFNLWCAKKTGDLTLAEYSKMCYENKREISIYDLLLYNPNIYNNHHSVDLDKYFNSTQLVTMRSSYNKNATFTGFKGGTTGISHSDLDIGSFVFDSLGIRWVEDLGSENYNLSGYWDFNSTGKRWSYYRKRAEGHNTLIIGQSKNEDQVVPSTSNIVENDLNSEDPYTVLDMTSAYGDRALNVKRKIQFFNERKDMTIEDSFVLKQCEDVVWQMHTRADVDIFDDGKTIILKQNGKTLKMLVYSDCDINTDVIPVKISKLEDDSNLKKVEIKTNSRDGFIKVKLIPMGELEPDNVTVRNGDFKNNLNNWWKVWDKYNNFDVEIDKDGYKEENSMKMSSRDGNPAQGVVNQSIDISTFKGSLFRLNQYIKRENFNGILKLKYTFRDEDGNNIGVTQEKTLIESGTEDWRLVEIALNVPSEAKEVLIEYLYDNSVGAIWIDDIEQMYDLGDVNKDGNIDVCDIALVASKYNKVNGVDGVYTKYDLNKDGIVDIYDICKVSYLSN